MKRASTWLALGLVAASLLGSACVYGPENGTFFDPHENLQLDGLASNPSATIRLMAFNLQTEQWVQIGEATSSTYTIHLNDNKTFYPWSLTFKLDDDPNWECYYEPTCSIDSEGVREIRFQLLEPNGDSSFLYTFDEGGLDCWTHEYNSGKDAYVAYWNCKADIFDELRLNSAFVF